MPSIIVQLEIFRISLPSNQAKYTWKADAPGLDYDFELDINLKPLYRQRIKPTNTVLGTAKLN